MWNYADNFFRKRKLGRQGGELRWQAPGRVRVGDLGWVRLGLEMLGFKKLPVVNAVGQSNLRSLRVKFPYDFL